MRPIIGINLDVAEADGRSRLSLPVEYVDAVVESGGRPRLVAALGDESLLRDEAEGVEAFLFIGGADYPSSSYGELPHEKARPMSRRRATSDLLLARFVLQRTIPVLGICGGCQLLSIAAGGKLVQHLHRAEGHRGRRHDVELAAGSRLARIFGASRIEVNSSHHQAVNPAVPGRELAITARADDGTVEAVEATGRRFLLGVQWHPERLEETHRRQLFGALVSAAKADRSLG